MEDCRLGKQILKYHETGIRRLGRPFEILLDDMNGYRQKQTALSGPDFVTEGDNIEIKYGTECPALGDDKIKHYISEMKAGTKLCTNSFSVVTVAV